jgi:hypothetical protein
MTTNNHLRIIVFSLIAASLAFIITVEKFAFEMPATGTSQFIEQFNITTFKESTIANASQVTQVSVSRKFSYSVVQSGNNAPSGNLIGQYAYATSKGNIGLLAHN